MMEWGYLIWVVVDIIVFWVKKRKKGTENRGCPYSPYHGAHCFNTDPMPHTGHGQNIKTVFLLSLFNVVSL